VITDAQLAGMARVPEGSGYLTPHCQTQPSLFNAVHYDCITFETDQSKQHSAKMPSNDYGGDDHDWTQYWLQFGLREAITDSELQKEQGRAVAGDAGSPEVSANASSSPASVQAFLSLN